MRRIRSLPESAGPGRDVLVELRELYLLAGEPSVRAIARSTGALSHDTVHRVLTGPELPNWRPLELVVKALNGDVDAFRQRWVAARRAMEEKRG
jgi:hypothetical protein